MGTCKEGVEDICNHYPMCNGCINYTLNINKTEDDVMEKTCDNCKYYISTCRVNSDLRDYGCIWDPIEHDDLDEEDMVNSPPHYNEYQTEVIDIIKAALTDEEYKGYLKGNLLKYRLRAGLKSKDKREEDLDKSNWYQDRL